MSASAYVPSMFPNMRIVDNLDVLYDIEYSGFYRGVRITEGSFIYVKEKQRLYIYTTQNGVLKTVSLQRLTRKNWACPNTRSMIINAFNQLTSYTITNDIRPVPVPVGRLTRPLYTESSTNGGVPVGRLIPEPVTSMPPRNQQRHIHTHTSVPEDEESTNLLEAMFNSLTEEKREEIKQEYASNKFFTNRCKICDKFTTTSNKRFCIKSGCTGMCTDCEKEHFPTGTEKCPSCQQTQKIDCPICLDEKNPEDVIIGKNCSHGICLRCFAESHRCGKPISKCPMCRVNFH